ETVRLAFTRWTASTEGSDGEIRIFCPMCEDPDESKSPSASINPISGLFNCQKGNHGGTIYALVQDMRKRFGFDIRKARMEALHSEDSSFASAAKKNLSKSGKRRGKLPTAAVVKRWHRDL